MWSNRFFMLLMGVVLSSATWAQPLDKVEGTNLLTGRPVSVVSGNLGLVVVFLSAKCPCSNSHIAELKDLAKTYSKFTFIGIHSNGDEDLEFSRQYFTQLKLPFYVIDDSAQKWANELRAAKTPHVFVFNSKGDMQFQGGVSDSSEFSRAEKKYLREALGNLNSGRTVEQSSVRTLGCAISRRSTHDVH